MKSLLTLAICLVTAGSLCAQSKPYSDQDTMAITAVVKKYQDARDERDPKAVKALFTEDADQLVSSGEWRKGREAIVKGTMASSEANSGKRTLRVETIRFIDKDAVIADARYEIEGTEGRPTRKMWSTFLMKRVSGKWLISGIRNMAPTAPSSTAASK